MIERVKALVDSIIVEGDFNKQCVIFETLLEEVVTYAIQDYKSCREIIQPTLGQLERIPNVSIPCLFHKIIMMLEVFHVEQGAPSYLDYVNADWGDDVKELLNKVAPYVGGEQKTIDLHPEVAEVLNADERKRLASCVFYYIQAEGVKSQWSNDIFQNAFILCNIIYPICKKDGVTPLLFHAYGNIIDRLNTSGNSQDARDVAEGVLILGYNEEYEAESFLCASRAYTGANNVIGGLLFLYISLSLIIKRGSINEKLAFDLFWQYIKICRTLRIYPKQDIEKVSKRFDKVINNNSTLNI